MITEEKLNVLYAEERARNVRLAAEMCDKLKSARAMLDEGPERELFDAILRGVRSWRGHVASFGYIGVRKRRATICIDMDEIEQPTEK